MKIKRVKEFIFIILFLLMGCAMQPHRIVQMMISNYPEVVINTSDLDHVRYEIFAEMQVVGFLLKDDSKYRMCFTKELLDIGSAQQKNLKAEIMYSLSQMENVIKITLLSSVMWSYDSRGTVLNQEDMKDNGIWRNYFYNILRGVKTSIESA